MPHRLEGRGPTPVRPWKGASLCRHDILDAHPGRALTALNRCAVHGKNRAGVFESRVRRTEKSSVFICVCIFLQIKNDYRCE
ncbi:hypothetical protein NDU88_004882 [Pleurodeles waltl]|uniref:Uncharacterized protein n=1 Tax=Pleurodeles waltl TaxID=8319 RepID=A0AAV7TVJ0_PLEWA|nr:hypothetical protein NDU88_004882 [Pleurodeles waltl]